MTLNKFSPGLEPMETRALNKNDVCRLKGSEAGKIISCLRGVIWITQRGDGVDRILFAGEAFHTRLPGYVVVQALTASRIKTDLQKKVGLVKHFRRPPRRSVACTC